MKFRVFLVLFWRRMWLESFLCLKGLGTASLGVKKLNDNPYLEIDNSKRCTNIVTHMVTNHWMMRSMR